MAYEQFSNGESLPSIRAKINTGILEVEQAAANAATAASTADGKAEAAQSDATTALSLIVPEETAISSDSIDLQLDRARHTSTPYTPSGNVTISIPESGKVAGAKRRFRLIMDGVKTVSFVNNDSENTGLSLVNINNNEVLTAGTYTFIAEYEAGVVIIYCPENLAFEYVDTSAPLLDAFTVSDVAETGATLNIRSNEPGTIYYAVYPSADAAHTKGEILAGTGAVLFDDALTIGGIVEQIALAGLTELMGYKVHLYAVDSSDNETTVYLSSTFTTLGEGEGPDLSLRLFYDASDDATITTAGGNVSAITDKSEGGYDAAQATGTKQPNHNTTTDIIAFTSANQDHLIVGDIAEFEFQQSDDFTVVLKDVKTSAAAGYLLGYKQSDAVGNPGWGVLLGSPSTLYFSMHDGTTQNFAQLPNFADGVAKDLILVNEAGVLKIYDVTNTNVGTNGSTSIGTISYTGLQLVIGHRHATAATTFFYNGEIGQIKIYNKALSEAERATELGL